MLQRNMDAEAHKSRDSNETNPSIARRTRVPDVHEFTVPHSAGSCAIPSPAETHVQRSSNASSNVCRQSENRPEDLLPPGRPVA
jgi:hypothetical protein